MTPIGKLPVWLASRTSPPHNWSSSVSLPHLRRAAVVVLVALGLTASFTASAYAAAPSRGGKMTNPVGNDVSWPQCSKTLPTGQAFGIVGVNDGLANNTNPCLSTQLAWAANSTGVTKQPKSAVYANTGNPSGVAGIAWWPTSNVFYHTTDGSNADTNTNTGYDAVTVPNGAYGDCSSTNDAGCSYVYGYAKAYDDVNHRGVPSTSPAGLPWTWWLDVETTNTWESTNLTPNLADLEAMASYFHTVAGASVGIYSTSYQWNLITGTPASTPLAGLANWIPGARTLKAAQSNCGLKPFTPNSAVVLTQYTANQLDSDYSCM
jgi:hypothetical protein